MKTKNLSAVIINKNGYTTISVQKFASFIGAYKNCIESKNEIWEKKWGGYIDEVEKHLPSGSGFDSGCTIDKEKSNSELIVISTSFHHMDENGMYEGWTDHNVKIVPSFSGGFKLKISGINKNDIKEYMYQIFYELFTF